MAPQDEWWTNGLKTHPVTMWFTMYMVCLAGVTIAADLWSLWSVRVPNAHSIAYRYLFVLIWTAFYMVLWWGKVRSDERKRRNAMSPDP
jgi:hypothetical protein